MLYYQLAGLKVGIECENEYLIKRMKPFQTEAVSDTDMVIHVGHIDRLVEPVGEVLITERLIWKRKPNPEEGFTVYITNGNDAKAVILKMDASADWSQVSLSIDKKHYIAHEIQGAARCEYIYPFTFCGVAFRNMLIHNDGLVIHSSSIAFRGKGIIFTAPSGTGKSTHVNLWEEAFGKEVVVVNDDTPAIRFINGVPMLSGTPWSGSSDKFANIQIPVKAIVILEQYPENVIRKLKPVEALPMLMPRCLLPYFDEKAMAIACELIEKLLAKVDLYHLRCLPDKDAVELAYKSVL